MDVLVRGLNSKVETIEKDLIDSLDVYHRHYKEDNHDNLKTGTNFWNNIH